MRRGTIVTVALSGDDGKPRPAVVIQSERLSTVLTDDLATLKPLGRDGMEANILRALASDLGYRDAWCRAATGSPSPGLRPRTSR